MLMGSFAAISPQTPSVKRKMPIPATATPLPKSRLSDIVDVPPTVSSPLASKSSRLGAQWFQANGSDTPFARRRQPGALLQTLNQHIGLPALDSIRDRGQIPFSVNVDMKKFAFRTMHQTLMAASEGTCDTTDKRLTFSPR